jgi:hypothetical protein
VSARPRASPDAQNRHLLNAGSPPEPEASSAPPLDDAASHRAPCGAPTSDCNMARAAAIWEGVFSVRISRQSCALWLIVAYTCPIFSARPEVPARTAPLFTIRGQTWPPATVQPIPILVNYRTILDNKATNYDGFVRKSNSNTGNHPGPNTLTPRRLGLESCEGRMPALPLPRIERVRRIFGDMPKIASLG